MKAKKAWNLIRANDGLSATLELYGDITEERPISFWTDEPVTGEYIVPAEFQSDLDSISNCNDVTIHINSYGGEVYAAIAIYNKIKSFKGNVTVIIDGIAASAASVIAMAGKTVKMASGSLMMIHEPSAVLMDQLQLDDVKKIEGWLESTTKAITGIYASRTGKAEDEIRDMLKAETWMTDKEAVENGFADEIDEGNQVQVTASLDHRMIFASGRSFDVSKCVNLPKLKIGDEQPSGQALHHIESKKEEKRMDLNEFKEKSPDLYASLMSEAAEAAKAAQDKAVKEAVQAEDDRIKAIDEIASVCSPEMVNEAKFGETKCSAETLAFRAIKAQKEINAKMGKNIVQDALESGTADVKAIGNNGNVAPKPKTDDEEIAEIVAKFKKESK